MSRKLKTLGIALIAVFALTAVAASAASANTFTSTTSPGKLVANQEGTHKFTITGQTVTCTKAEFTSVPTFITTPTSTVEVHPVYEGCTAFGFVGANVTTTGCNYKLTAGHLASGKYNLPLSIVCSGSNVIKITVSTCEAQVGGQSFPTGNLGSNLPTSPTTVKLETNLTEIAAKVTKSGILCPLTVGEGSKDISSYVGNTIVKGFNEAGTQVGVGISGTE
jgi:hypothetical protein